MKGRQAVHTSRFVLALVAGVVLSTAGARAESVGAPRFVENDRWTYQDTVENRTGWHQTHDEVTLARPGSSSIAVSVKPVGSTMPPSERLLGADWSRSRSVNGHQTVTNRPVAFPLSIGKTWDVEYTEDHPNRLHSSEHFKTVYKVVAWEDVTVPAGNFRALKIEAEGEWSAAIAPAVSAAAGTRVDAQGATTIVQTGRTTAATASGRLYKAFWYVPAVKRWVKSVEEVYSADSVRTERFTEELESFKVAD